MNETRSTCPYCGVGCGVIIEAEAGQITGVRGDPEHPANFGRLCTKGSTLHLTAAAAVTRQTRLLQPLRRLQRGAAPQPIGWDDALDLAAARFATIIERDGPDAVGFYVSGQLLTEDYYVFNKLAKGLVGTNNVDTNSRLCMSSAVAGYKLTLGADSPPACYDDLAHAATLFIAGSNAAYAHPILFRRIEDARAANPALKIVVVDPRLTETAQAADLHLQILPGTDVALFHAMLHVMLWEGWVDPAYIGAHTSGFDALRARVRDFAPKDVAKLCGIKEADLIQAARWFANMEAGAPAGRAPTLSLYCQGLNQSTSGTLKNAALINLHLATGQIGRPGAGPFSLTGQPNAMGGREVGGLATLLSAHRDLANPEHRAEVAALWGVDSVPAAPGKSAVEMFEAAADGAIKALWIACTNPAQSMPDQAMVRRALERAEFVVVQEAFATTATCAYADLLLPATTWGEKDGTVTNSERRISRVRPAVAAPGETREDWAIAVALARRLEARLRPGRATLFPYADARAVWNEHRESTRGRDLDITGLSYAQLERASAQWPWPEGASVGKARLYEDGVFPTADGRAVFADAPFEPVAEPRDARHPFALNTGRLRDQWHGMSRTGTLGRLFGHVPEPLLDMNAQDMARLGLADGDLVRVGSRRGGLVIPVQASAAQPPAQVFVAMHWGEEVLGGTGDDGVRHLGVNALTTPKYCPRSKQPELKNAAVRIEKAALPWRLLALAWLPDDAALAARNALRPLLHGFGFASLVPFGRERSGVLLRAAAREPLEAALLREIEGHLGLAVAGVLHYADARRGQRRTVRLSGHGEAMRLEAFLFAGDIAAEAWVRPLLQSELPAQAYGRSLLMPGAKPPVALAPRGRQICSCFDVSEPAIEAALATLTGSPEAR
ncbi:MAG TPA: molybdopterin-dependent oxidoreductase, partial [Burkholderiaceae bacterium]|nr:molybdopterin-dependent oxidoreductase [Burkholderiaceae bacterium]